MTSPHPFQSSQTLQGLYRHYKGKNYNVLGTAKHSETLEDFIVYQALYDNHEMWVRPAAMFLENIQVDGNTIPRFQKIDGEKP